MQDSGLALLPLRSDHVWVELADDDGDVIAVHASQFLGQRQHLGEPLVVDGAKLIVAHRVAHQVGRRVLVFKGGGGSSLPLLQQALHLSQRDPVASHLQRLALVHSRQKLPHDPDHFLSVEGLPQAVRANHLQAEAEWAGFASVVHYECRPCSYQQSH